MQRFREIRRDQFGNPASGVTCDVFVSGTAFATRKSLFYDNDNSDTASTVIPNPVISGADGIIAFACADGDCDLKFTGADGTVEYRLYQNFFDSSTATTIPVSSISLTMPTELSVSGSPGTSIAVTKATQTPNYIYAGPASGGVAQPTFRAMVALDLNAVAVDKSTAQVAIGGAKTWTGAQTWSSTVAGTSATFSSTVAVTGNVTMLANVIMEKTSKIQVNSASPDYPYKSVPGLMTGTAFVNGTLPTKTLFQGTIYLAGFSAAATNELQYSIDLPWDYESGSDVIPYVDWSPNGTNTGVARWGIEYSAVKAFTQGAFAAPTTITKELASPGTQYELITSSFAAITGTAFEPGTKFTIRLFRDGAHVNDTLTDLTFLHGFGLIYKASRPGAKNATPPFYT